MLLKCDKCKTSKDYPSEKEAWQDGWDLIEGNEKVFTFCPKCSATEFLTKTNQVI